jgi:hypothetical protein
VCGCGAVELLVWPTVRSARRPVMQASVPALAPVHLALASVSVIPGSASAGSSATSSAADLDAPERGEAPEREEPLTNESCPHEVVMTRSTIQSAR